MRINIKVIPRSSRNEIIALPDGSYKAKLTAAPVDGKANDALIKLISEHFKVAKSNIEILKGQTSKNKVIFIH